MIDIADTDDLQSEGGTGMSLARLELFSSVATIYARTHGRYTLKI